jgi:hypothetical protein
MSEFLSEPKPQTEQIRQCVMLYGTLPNSVVNVVYDGTIRSQNIRPDIHRLIADFFGRSESY